LENLKEIDHLEDFGVDGTVLLKGIIKNVLRGCELDSYGSGWGPVASSGKCGNQSPVSIKGGKFLDYQPLSNGAGWYVCLRIELSLQKKSAANKLKFKAHLLTHINILSHCACVLGPYFDHRKHDYKYIPTTGRSDCYV
jgi:hypothetical protein